MNETANDPLKNIFIKYLDTALNRTKDRFVKQMERQGKYEIALPDEGLPYDFYRFLEEEADIQRLPAGTEASQIRSWICGQTQWNLAHAFQRLNDREVVIVYLKVFEKLTFAEIGEKLGEDWKKTASSYTYARKKLRKGIENEF